MPQGFIRSWCAEQDDCKGCPFAENERHCTINTIPAIWENEIQEEEQNDQSGT